MAGRPDVSSELSRDLSLFQVTMMGLGMMIGAGVFLGTGKSIGFCGPGGVLLTFALNGLIAILTAMSYAELSSAIPKAGGAYNFARIGFGRGTSFVAGWMEWFASSVAGALYAVCFATYTVRFFSSLNLVEIPSGVEPFVLKGVAASVACIFIYINYRGASETGKVGAIMTLAQTVFLLVIGAIGIVVAIRDPSRLDNFKPFLNPEQGRWAGLLVTMGFTAVAFEGYEVIAQAGDETIDPRRNIPKAMLYSVLIVTFTYVLCAFAAVVAVKAGPGLVVDGQVVSAWQWIGHHGGEGFGAAVELLIPKWGGLLVVLAVIFASTSALNATIYSATRASYALGRDRMLPEFFARISRARKTPWVALISTGVIVLIVATCLDAEQVAASASIMFLFLFLLVNLCVIRIRFNMGDELHYGFLMPFFPVLPVIAILCQAVLAVFLHEMGPIAWLIAPVWIVTGVAIYHFYSKSRAVATEHEIQVIEEESALPGNEYRIMVSVANPENALPMVRTTYALCGAKQARVELLHMVPVPDQVPLSDAGSYMTEGKEAIGELMLYLAPLFPLSSTIRYCRNVARGIVSAVKEKRADLLIIGWHGGAHTRGYALGSTVDPVVERSPCDVLILKLHGDKTFKRILVPVAGGVNSVMAMEIASILALKHDGEVVVFNASVSGSPAFNVEEFVAQNAGQGELPLERIRTKVKACSRVEDAILEEAESAEADYDLVVLGCSDRPLIRQFTGHTVPETIARRCSKPLIMVKASQGIRSFVKRWI